MSINFHFSHKNKNNKKRKLTLTVDFSLLTAVSIPGQSVDSQTAGSTILSVWYHQSNQSFTIQIPRFLFKKSSEYHMISRDSTLHKNQVRLTVSYINSP